MQTPKWIWIPQLVAAAIMGQTLFFKWSAAPEAVALFETLGAEPWGRWATAAGESLAVALLLIPATAALGGLLATGLMVGALGAHFTTLGIEVEGDGGTLFAMAWITLVSGLLVAWVRRRQLPVVGTRFRRTPA